MNRNATVRLVIVAFCICYFSSKGYTQGDNNPNPLVNLALIDGAAVTGSVPIGQARGIPEDILWDPSTNDWATVSTYHEYGMVYDSMAYKIKEDPLWWQVIWPTAKIINYITCTGTYPNQPQPTTGWAVQIMVDDEWQDLAKAHNGWDADTLRGAGAGIPTQTNWLWDGQLVWRGLEPVVTTGIRLTAYANPDSVTDGVETFADSLWSFVWSGRDFGSGTAKAALIQYLDYSETTADNKLDPMLNLALLDEAVVSTNFQKGDSDFGEWIRNQPADMLYDPVKDDYHNKNTSWGEFGYPYNYDAGYPDDPEDGFQYIVEWPIPKKINYFTWGGCYGGNPQDYTPWALQYWDGEAWETLIDGVGGSGWDWEIGEYDTLWPYTPGISSGAKSIWMVPEADAITTNKIRLAAWSDGNYPLFSFHIRCRGGACINNDDSENPFKAVLVQYADIKDPTAIGSEDLVQPAEFALHQNYPNPFNPETTIKFVLHKNSHVRLSVYNIMGQEVTVLVDEMKSQGTHQVTFDATNLASGVYFYKLKTNQGVLTKKMMILQQYLLRFISNDTEENTQQIYHYHN